MASGAVYAQTTKSFGDFAEGPYNRLVVQNIMVIPGHGGPPVGPYDIEIEGNMIAKMTPFDPVTAERRGQTKRATGDRVIDGTGKYLMPGMIDMHMHLRKEPMEVVERSSATLRSFFLIHSHPMIYLQ